MNDNPKLEMFARRFRRDRCGELPALGGEIAAGGEKSLSDAVAGNCCGDNFAAELFAETDHVEGFFEMQLARFSTGVATVVIVHAIGEVGTLLNFAEDEAAADGVSGTGRDKHRIARAQWNVLQGVFDGSIGDRTLETFGGDVGLEPDENFGAGRCVNHIPHFCFAAAAGGLFVN